MNCFKHREKKPDILLYDIEPKPDEDVTLDLNSTVLLKRIDSSQRYFFKYHVEENCSLREFVEQQGLEYKRGCAYYEFKEYTENISEDKEVVLYCEVLCITEIIMYI